MVNCLSQTAMHTGAASARAAAADRHAAWHLGSTVQIPTVGTGFKPYGKRPKEKLS